MWLYAPAATSPCPQVWSAGGMLGSVWGSWVSDGPVRALAPACLCLGLEWPPSTSGACYSWQITPPWLTLLPCPPHAPSPRLAWSLISPTRQPLAMGRDRTEEKEEGERGEQAGAGGSQEQLAATESRSTLQRPLRWDLLPPAQVFLTWNMSAAFVVEALLHWKHSLK